ncbi:MAG: hypothetical protein HYV78_01705, partial [Candidatus Wildermuthbacteria bacterium]|nr:hypothetical protein [Candidatus Wildermuthbacteria bacterium]
ALNTLHKNVELQQEQLEQADDDLRATDEQIQRLTEALPVEQQQHIEEIQRMGKRAERLL